MIRRVTSSRRLLRKRMYNAPHTRHKNATYYRENKNLIKSHQKEFKDSHAPVIRRKRRPKREVMSGFKMSYRYKYYSDDVVDDEEIDEEEC
ncbi:MAG: hypothetical protein IJI93_07035 [Methanobrevibacter sp.]|nr:hypothetical protein [Methanobrevibacter sp.]